MSNKEVMNNKSFMEKIAEDILDAVDDVNKDSKQLDGNIRDFEKNMEKGARKTDHRFKL